MRRHASLLCAVALIDARLSRPSVRRCSLARNTVTGNPAMELPIQSRSRERASSLYRKCVYTRARRETRRKKPRDRGGTPTPNTTKWTHHTTVTRYFYRQPRDESPSSEGNSFSSRRRTHRVRNELRAKCESPSPSPFTPLIEHDRVASRRFLRG